MTRATRSLALVLALTACGDATAPRAVDVHALRAVQLDAPPTATVATNVTVRVVVRDTAGQVVAGQIVNFIVTDGGGSVYAPAGITGKDGIVSELWTLGQQAGPQTLEARAVDSDGNPLLLGKVSAIATPGQAVSISGTDVVFWTGERRDLGSALGARDKFGNFSPLSLVDAKLDAGAFKFSGDTITAPDTIGVVGTITVTVAGEPKALRIFTAPNMRARTLTYRSACPAAGYDSVVQVTVQDAVAMADDRRSFSFTGRTTSLAYWLGGQVVKSSPASHSATTGAAVMSVLPDTLRSSVETFVRKADAPRYLQTRFVSGGGACGVAPFSASYWVQ